MRDPNGAVDRMFLHRADGTFVDLGQIPGSSAVTGIDYFGNIVGQYDVSGLNFDWGFLLQPSGAMIDVNTLVPPSPWQLTRVNGINAHGQMIVIGHTSVSGSSPGALRIDPVPASAATTNQVGSGCSSSPLAPSLDATPPRLGAPLTITMLHGGASAQGTLLASPGFGVTVPVSPQCSLYLQPATLVPISMISTNAAGNWALPLELPVTGGLAGLSVTLQAITADLSSPIGYAFSNGVEMTLGL